MGFACTLNLRSAAQGCEKKTTGFLFNLSWGVREEFPEEMASDSATKVGRGWIAQNLVGHVENFHFFPKSNSKMFKG